MTKGLMAFVRARLDETERIARAASGNSPWRPDARFGHGLDHVEGDGWTVCSASEEEVVHIARHDPTRVLRDVAAKRALLDAYEHAWSALADLSAQRLDAPDAERWKHYAVAVQVLKPHVMALAAVYDDHPDYRAEWRP